MSALSFRKIFIGYFVAFGIAVVFLSSVISYYMQKTTLEQEIKEKANQIAHIKIDTILDPTLKQLNNIVLSLSKNTLLQNYLTNPTQENKESLQQVFFAVAATNNTIMQLRYLDKDGNEMIRIDRQSEDKDPYFVDEKDLQNKAHRDYFKTIKTLPKAKTWHSKWNLNMEMGKIEVPYKPTLRVGIAVYEGESFRGSVIVNVLTNNLNKAIKNSSTFEHYVVDNDGYYLLHPQNRYQWNRYTQVQRTIQDDFGYENLQNLKENRLNKELFVFELDSVLNNDDDALLILKPKDEFLATIFENKLKTSSLAAFLSILASVFIAFYLSKRPTKIQKELHLANNELKKFNEIIDRYVIIAHTTKKRVITKVSTAFCELSGYTKDELIGKRISLIKHTDNPKELFDDLKRKIYASNGWRGEIKNRKKDGSEYWLEQNIIPLVDNQNKLTGFMSIGIDITAKKELERISATDMLTKVYNRRKIVQLLEGEINKAQRYQQDVCVILLDIDHFKHTNDTFGHKAGDLVLVETAQLIVDNIRKSDFFGRYGGEEFLIICPNAKAQEAFEVAQKVKDVIQNHKFDEVGYKTISLGVSEYTPNDTSDTLIHKADVALYYSKENGRNQANVYSKAMESE